MEHGKYLVKTPFLRISGLIILTFSIGWLLIPQVWSGDVYGSLVGGCLISHGVKMYTGFFSHHAPLADYIAGFVDTITHTCTYILPQLFFYAFFVASVLLLVKYTESFFSASFLLVTYAAFGIVYGTTFVLAESWLDSISILLFLLLFFQKSMSNIIFWIVFIIVQFSIQTAVPLYMPIAFILLVFFAMQDKTKILYYVLGSYIPFIVFLLYLGIANYYHAVFLFNVVYYAPYTNSYVQQYLTLVPSIVSTLIHIGIHPQDWKSMDTFAFLFTTIVLILWVFLHIKYKKKVYRKNTFLFFINLLIFLTLSIHTGGGHLVPITFFAFAEILWIFSINPLPMVCYPVLFILFILLVRLLRFEIVLYTTEDYSQPFYTKFILAHSKATDKILSFPGDNALYVLTNRMPGSYYFYMLPWVSDQKGVQERVFHDIQKEKVKIIITDDTNPFVTIHSLSRFMTFIETHLSADRHYNEVSTRKGVKIFLRIR